MEINLPSVQEQISMTSEINKRIKDICLWKPTKTRPTEPGWYPMQIAHVEWHYEQIVLIDGELCIRRPDPERIYVPFSDLNDEIWWGPKAVFPSLEPVVETLQEEMEL